MRRVTRRRNLVLERVRRDRVIAAAQEGLSASWEHADDAWKSAALSCLLWVSANFPTVKADDVWARLEAKHPTAETHEKSAMGGVFTTAASLGWITSTGRREPSTRETNHRDQLVWASNLYLGRDAIEVSTCEACEGHGALLRTVDRYLAPNISDVPTPRAVPSPKPVDPPPASSASKQRRGGAQSKTVDRPQRTPKPDPTEGMTEDEKDAYWDMIARKKTGTWQEPEQQ